MATADNTCITESPEDQKTQHTEKAAKDVRVPADTRTADDCLWSHESYQYHYTAYGGVHLHATPFNPSSSHIPLRESSDQAQSLRRDDKMLPTQT